MVGRCGRPTSTTVTPGAVLKYDAAGRFVHGRARDDAADGAAGHDLRAPVRKLRRIGVVPRDAVPLVHAVAVDHVVGAVLAADTEHVDRAAFARRS